MNNIDRITKLEEMLEKIQKELDEIKWSNNDNECKVDTFERVKSQEAFYNIILKDTTTVLEQFETEYCKGFNEDCFKNNNYKINYKNIICLKCYKLINYLIHALFKALSLPILSSLLSFSSPSSSLSKSSLN